MSSVTERESKFELEEAAFTAILERMKAAKVIDQETIYFDDSWRLAKLAATCRLRVSAEECTLTLKVPVQWEGDVRTSREIPLKLEPATAAWLRGSREIEVETQLPPELGEALLPLGVNCLRQVGKLDTRRYRIVVQDLGKLDLDVFDLPNGVRVFEAEIETEDAAAQGRLAGWLKVMAPTARPVRASKFERLAAVLVGNGVHH